MGTNDIGDAIRAFKRDKGNRGDVSVYFDIERFQKNFTHLLHLVWGHIRGIHVVVCSILPRLVDYQWSKGLVNAANSVIRQMCYDQDAEYLNLSKGFCVRGVPSDHFFYRDNLHLSYRGNVLLVKAVKKSRSEYKNLHGF